MTEIVPVPCPIKCHEPSVKKISLAPSAVVTSTETVPPPPPPPIPVTEEVAIDTGCVPFNWPDLPMGAIEDFGPIDEQRFPFPPGLSDIVQEVIVELLRYEPDDIYLFLANYFHLKNSRQQHQRKSSEWARRLSEGPEVLGEEELQEFLDHYHITKELADKYASRIEAAFRGHQVRKSFQNKLHKDHRKSWEWMKWGWEGSSQLTDEQKEQFLKDLNLEEEKANANAAKIQAAFRGHQVRRSLMKKLHKDHRKSWEWMKWSWEGSSKLTEEQMEQFLKDLHLEAEEANANAVKIQAAFRGHLVRHSAEDRRRIHDLAHEQHHPHPVEPEHHEEEPQDHELPPVHLKVSYHCRKPRLSGDSHPSPCHGAKHVGESHNDHNDHRSSGGTSHQGQMNHHRSRDSHQGSMDHRHSGQSYRGSMDHRYSNSKDSRQGSMDHHHRYSNDSNRGSMDHRQSGQSDQDHMGRHSQGSHEDGMDYKSGEHHYGHTSTDHHSREYQDSMDHHSSEDSQDDRMDRHSSEGSRQDDNGSEGSHGHHQGATHHGRRSDQESEEFHKRKSHNSTAPQNYPRRHTDEAKSDADGLPPAGSPNHPDHHPEGPHNRMEHHPGESHHGSMDRHPGPHRDKH